MSRSESLSSYECSTLCMIHEAIGNQNAIAKVAMAGVKIALEAGWKVTVVAKFSTNHCETKSSG